MTLEHLFERGDSGSVRTIVGRHTVTLRISSAADPNNEWHEAVSEFKIRGRHENASRHHAQGQKTRTF